MSDIEDRAALIAEAGEYADAIQGGESDNWKRLVVCVDNLANALALSERDRTQAITDAITAEDQANNLAGDVAQMEQKLTEQAATLAAIREWKSTTLWAQPNWALLKAILDPTEGAR